ncbi:MAG: hypothetical protein ACYC6L_06125 [Anaerolineae bacterium]
MKYRVHRLAITLASDQAKLEHFLNSLEGEVVAIIPNVTMGKGSFGVHMIDFILVVEKLPAAA